MLSLLIPLLISVIIFALLFWVDLFNPLLTEGLLFLLFAWAFIAFDLSLFQKVFYPLLLVFSIVMRNFLKVEVSSTKGSFAGEKLSGVKFHLFTFALGILITVLMFFMQSSKSFTILGFPTLSIASTGFVSGVTAVFSPAISGALGIIENRAFLVFFKLIKLVGVTFKPILEALTKVTALIPFIGWLFALFLVLLSVLTPVMPFLAIMFLFGLFHVISYGILVGAMIWAGLIFGIWLVSYFITKEDDTAMNVSHYLWNSIKTGTEAFKIAT